MAKINQLMSLPNTNHITVVIVTFNNEKIINRCVDSIFKHSPDSKIIVVDNNSADNTLVVLKQYGDKIKLIKSDINLGFSKANNLAAKDIETEFIVFLNPDTYLSQVGSLEKLRDTLSDNPGFGIIGPKLILSDGEVQKTARNLPTVKNAFRTFILGDKKRYDFYLPEGNNLCSVESIVGACFIIKKSVFNKINGFDERYFMYFEDLELCRKILKIGLKIGFLPTVKIIHLHGDSGKGQRTSDYLHSSAKKYHGLVDYYFIQLLIRFNNFLHG